MLFTFVLFPNSSLNNRFIDFLGELTSSDSSTITEENAQEAFDAMEKIQTDSSGSPSAGDIVSAVIDGTAKEELASGAISQEEYDALKSFSQSMNNTATGARKYLWQSALKEIKSAPLTGQGPLFFQSKYGTYPHNFFFELATDFGLILMLAVLLLGLYVFFRLIRLALRFPAYMAFTLYVLTFLPQIMVSGSAYGHNVFFQYGFCILFVLFGGNSYTNDTLEGL